MADALSMTLNPLAAQIDAMLRVSPRADGYDAVLRVDPSLSVLPDHFPQQAILPGICMVQAVLLGAGRALGLARPMRLASLKNAKLMHPALPGDVLAIAAVVTAHDVGRWQVKARITLDHAEGPRRVAEFSLVAAQAEAPLAPARA